ncbi:hypothetical protein [Streptomyces mirabilis]|uniref:hypothetical protein n=1 Tax=Streptomyces mirabilis TaxID=68239 RepID=UPI002252B3C3|nr:hypothetical protein [Streptomyces mirabilis]MCX4430250.1 hypothetical protein [Streptomyces mirabilis]
MKLGAYVTFQGCTWQVAAVAGASVTLVGENGQTASVLASFLVADPAFTVVGSPATGVQPWGLLESVPERERERALAWQRHIREIETGLPGGPGSVGMPRPEYDPQRQSMAEREQDKADELTRLGWPKVSRATVRRMRARYRDQGLWGLIPRRKPSSATGQADERVVAAVLEALRRQRGRCARPVCVGQDLPGQLPQPLQCASSKSPSVIRARSWWERCWLPMELSMRGSSAITSTPRAWRPEAGRPGPGGVTREGR